MTQAGKSPKLIFEDDCESVPQSGMDSGPQPLRLMIKPSQNHGYRCFLPFPSQQDIEQLWDGWENWPDRPTGLPIVKPSK